MQPVDPPRVSRLGYIKLLFETSKICLPITHEGNLGEAQHSQYLLNPHLMTK